MRIVGMVVALLAVCSGCERGQTETKVAKAGVDAGAAGKAITKPAPLTDWTLTYTRQELGVVAGPLTKITLRSSGECTIVGDQHKTATTTASPDETKAIGALLASDAYAKLKPAPAGGEGVTTTFEVTSPSGTRRLEFHGDYKGIVPSPAADVEQKLGDLAKRATPATTVQAPQAPAGGAAPRHLSGYTLIYSRQMFGVAAGMKTTVTVKGGEVTVEDGATQIGKLTTDTRGLDEVLATPPIAELKSIPARGEGEKTIVDVTAAHLKLHVEWNGAIPDDGKPLIAEITKLEQAVRDANETR